MRKKQNFISGRISGAHSPISSRKSADMREPFYLLLENWNILIFFVTLLKKLRWPALGKPYLHTMIF